MTLLPDSVTLRAVTVCLAAIGGATATAPAQDLAPSLVRLEAGSLNHGDLFRAKLALGATLGWRTSPQGTVLLRLLRQSQTEAGTDVGRYGRTLLMANWEHAFGVSERYKRQALIRFGVGAMFRPVLSTAPVLGAGLEVRYGLARHWSLLANIEDDAAMLPSQDATLCDAFRGCALYHFDAQLEHNIGLIISGEWAR